MFKPHVQIRTTTFSLSTPIPHLLTAFIRSKHQIRYGYIEAKVHPADSITSSAFWLVHNTKQTWNEIDVFELSQGKNQGSKYHMNMHLFRMNGQKLPKTLSKPKWHPLQFNACEKPFTASLLWSQILLLGLWKGFLSEESAMNTGMSRCGFSLIRKQCPGGLDCRRRVTLNCRQLSEFTTFVVGSALKGATRCHNN